MMLIVKLSLQLRFVRACTHMSILSLCSSPAWLPGSCCGRWWSLHSQEGKAAPSLWNSHPGSSGCLDCCPGGGVCAPSTSHPSASEELSCCCDTSEPASFQEKLGLVRQYSYQRAPVKLFFLHAACLGQNWRHLTMDSQDKWASNRIAVKGMVFFFM